MKQIHKNIFKVCIIGAGGAVGSTVAFALAISDMPIDIFLIDINEKLVRGQTYDLEDVAYNKNAKTYMGTYSDVSGSDLIIIVAGVAQEQGESRIDLLIRNLKIMKSVIDQSKPISDKTKILVVTNPVDILTHFIQIYSELPHNRVFGSGTVLDTARLKSYLSYKYNMYPSSFNISIVGEHGDGQVVLWNEATIEPGSLLENLKIDHNTKIELENEIKSKAYNIINTKGATYFGIASTVRELVKTVLYNQMQVYSLSNYCSEKKLYYSWPCILGNNGVMHKIEHSLEDGEKEAFAKSIKNLSDIISQCKQ